MCLQCVTIIVCCVGRANAFVSCSDVGNAVCEYEGGKKEKKKKKRKKKEEKKRGKKGKRSETEYGCFHQCESQHRYVLWVYALEIQPIACFFVLSFVVLSAYLWFTVLLSWCLMPKIAEEPMAWHFLKLYIYISINALASKYVSNLVFYAQYVLANNNKTIHFTANNRPKQLEFICLIPCFLVLCVFCFCFCFSHWLFFFFFFFLILQSEMILLLLLLKFSMNL